MDVDLTLKDAHISETWFEKWLSHSFFYQFDYTQLFLCRFLFNVLSPESILKKIFIDLYLR